MEDGPQQLMLQQSSADLPHDVVEYIMDMEYANSITIERPHGRRIYHATDLVSDFEGAWADVNVCLRCCKRLTIAVNCSVVESYATPTDVWECVVPISDELVEAFTTGIERLCVLEMLNPEYDPRAPCPDGRRG